jgi:hypothetical protein
LIKQPRGLALIVVALLSGGSAYGQESRGAPENVDRVRARFKSGAKAGGTTIDQSQAEAVTLTLSKVAVRPVQNWIRTAGTIDPSGKLLEAVVSGADSSLVKAGQRVRAFPPSSKSSMYQAFVTRVISRPSRPPAPRGDISTVQAALAAAGRENTALYVMEIVVERGPFLSVPNEAIIEEGARHIVYVQKSAGQYVPQEIHTGIQGELYTQVLDGVKEGDDVVTFGSFFIDAEHKLKGIDQSSPAATAK